MAKTFWQEIKDAVAPESDIHTTLRKHINDPVEEGEIVLGELSEDLQKLWALRSLQLKRSQELFKTAKELFEDTKRGAEGTERLPKDEFITKLKELKTEADDAEAKAATIERIIVQSLMDEFEEYEDGDSIGLRKGMQLVRIPDSSGSRRRSAIVLYAPR